MPLFQLIMQTSPQADPEALQFIAGDVPSALVFADRHTSSLPAELWCDGARVCRLEYSEQTGKWNVAGRQAKLERGSEKSL
jgi:hypothetical protein